MNIGVCGLGYVGLSNALLLASNEQVLAYDIDKEKISSLKDKVSPIRDQMIQERLALTASIEFTDDFKYCINNSDYLIVATPTDYDEDKNIFDTSSVKSVIKSALEIKKDILFIIKSTVPIGFTRGLKRELGTEAIIFAPEFLREGKALWDNLYPSRIIIGDKGKNGKKIAELFLSAADKKDAPVLLVDDSEAEAIKLFSNTYLALRVAYFNELDTFAQTHSLDAKGIIKGVTLDSRIGDYYNNPSFGYGGYCLPKDTKQLLSEYATIPNELIRAIVHSNKTRKDFIAADIISTGAKTVGVYSLAMKGGSDNFRYSSTISIIKRLLIAGINVLIFEPLLKAQEFMGCRVVDLEELKARTDLIITNRQHKDLSDVLEKVYTRDIFARD